MQICGETTGGDDWKRLWRDSTDALPSSFSLFVTLGRSAMNESGRVVAPFELSMVINTGEFE